MPVRTILSRDGMSHESGHCWTADNAKIGITPLIRGRLMPRVNLYEDGRLLGPCDFILEDIRHAGHGRYAPSDSVFRFSTSDNTDPRSNGREYVFEAIEDPEGALPPPRTMHVGITNACNMTCRICRTDDHFQSSSLSDSCIDKLVEEVFPTLQELRLDVAGEPTLHKPKFRRLVQEASRRGVPTFICTNAALIDEEMADFICAGTSVKRIQVSMDSPEKETLEWVRRGADFDLVLQGARNLVAAKRRHGRSDLILQCHAALMRQNLHHLPELVRLAHRIGLDRITCTFGTIHAYMDPDWSVFWEQEAHNQVIDEAEKVAAELGMPFRPWGRFDLDADPAATNLTDPGGVCYYLSHWTYIDPTGIVRPCCISCDHPLGDLNAGSFESIWHGEAYEALRRTYDTDAPTNPTCAKCYIRIGWNRHSYKAYFNRALWPEVRRRLNLTEEG